MNTTDPAERELFARQYIETALWSSVDGDGRALGSRFGAADIEPDTLAAMHADCAAFIDANAADLDALDAEQAGHDFWLTRNRHGAGYWDRGLGTVGERLTGAANAAGTCDLYVDDDGRLYADNL